MSIHDGVMEFTGGKERQYVGTQKAYQTKEAFTEAVQAEIGAHLNPAEVANAFIRRCYGGACGGFGVDEWGSPHYHVHTIGTTKVWVYQQSPVQAHGAQGGGA